VRPEERGVVDGWWREFVTSGAVPECFEAVQGRLIRAVHRAPLGDREVFVKTMTFPRWKDRLRYLFRRMPAAHEARMLRATAAAGVPCPSVVAAYTARGGGVPRRSMLVLESLPVAPVDPPRDVARGPERLAAEVALAARLLAAGIYHGDLHGDNFVLLDSGALAVLDMQSARVFRRGADARRRAVAARMLRELTGAEAQAAVSAMRTAGLLCSDVEVERALQESAARRAAYQRSRVRRCLQESTEFERRVTWRGVRHARRDRPRSGRWIVRGGALGDAWLGQRVLELNEGRAPLFGAYFRKWWWLGRGEGLYVSDSCSEAQIRAELDVARAVGRAWRDRPSA